MDPEVFNRSEWVVEGVGPFPLEMLHLDDCVPATMTDAHVIARSFREANTDARFVVRVARFAPPGARAVNQYHWRSRGWNVTEGWEKKR